jgi:hypothetical protein
MTSTTPAPYMVSSHSRLYNGGIMVLSGFFCGFSVANAVYYSKIMKDTTTPPISAGTAKTMMVINIIIAIITGILFLWFVYRTVFSVDTRYQVSQNLSTKYDQLAGQTSGYLNGVGGVNSFTSVYGQVPPSIEVPTGTSLLMDPAANS